MSPLQTFPTIQTERLLLREFTPNDLENVFKGLSHPEVIKYYGVSFKTLEATKVQMDWLINHRINETGIWWAVCSKDNNVFYGAGGLNDWDKKEGKAEIGFWLLPDYWGQGIFKEAMPLILDYGLKQLKLLRIVGFVESENGPCKKAIEKIDFRYEKTMKDCEVKNGQSISVDVYVKTN